MTTPAWFCCQQVRERVAIGAIARVILLPPLFAYPLALYDAIWFGVGQSLPARRLAFLEVYGLEIVTIGDADEQYLQVRDGYLWFWLEAAVFTLLPAQGCPDGCVRPPYVLD